MFFSECSSLLFVLYFCVSKAVPEWKGILWYEFSCGLRGFHVYSNIWKPKLNEKINITHERRNMYDPNAMAGKIMLPGTLVASIVGHIPKEVSRYTRYIVEHGASVDAFVLATHHRPSPLISRRTGNTN